MSRPPTDFSILQPGVDVNQIPKEKTPPLQNVQGFGQMQPAVNSGIVSLRCVINGKCPFVKNQRMHDVLTFNAQSIRNYTPDMQYSFDAVAGSEGIYNKPQYVYRHTFLAAPTSPKIDVGTGNGGKVGIELLQPTTGSFVSSAPVYERQQRFIITPNVFDTQFLKPSQYITDAVQNATSCHELARWQYESIQRGTLVEVDDQGNSNVPVLMPKMVAGTTCGGYGVHWRVEKQTPLYQGEDFFVEFHRRASSIDVPQSLLDTSNTFLTDQFKIPKYRPLDTKFTSVDSIPNTGNGNTTLYKNRGVVKYSNDGQTIQDDKTYDFRDQAYYVVEIGVGDATQNYFIIITQRGNPICVRIDTTTFTQPGSSILVSEFADGQNVENNAQNSGGKVSGRQIIEARWCRMTVRNHLGSLHIQFEGPNFKSNPWIISRVDKVIQSSSITGDVRKFLQDKPVLMYVPHATIALWGGNMQCGFLFGILQYLSGDPGGLGGSGGISKPISFIVPATSQEQASVSVAGSTNTNGPGLTATTGNLNNLTEDTGLSSLSLPSGITHEYSLTATDQNLPANPNKNQPFFTQDAQIFAWTKRPGAATGKTNPNVIIGGNGSAATFFNLPNPLKEVTKGKESKIAVVGLPMALDATGNACLFKIQIEMTPGGHDFPDDSNGYLNDNGKAWTVSACKTPVLCQVRLSADAVPKARWSVRSVDVSEHVLEYTDSWSAQDFFKIEHTGTIKFLVNPGATYVNDQTAYIKSLQNKAFYIEVWVQYQPSGDKGSNSNYSLLQNEYKLFTGLCYGGTITYELGQQIFETQIHDYSKILQDMLFFNSPFYDGVRDVNAVHEILQMAGFQDTSNDDPGILVAKFAKTTDQKMHFGIGPDGRLVPVAPYALPSAYAKLSQAYFKFNDGDKFYDAIMKIATRAGKCFFFDAYGVAHFESYFDYSVVGVISGIDNQLMGGTTPKCVNGKVQAGSQQIDPNSLAIWWYTSNPRDIGGQLVFNSVRAQRAVGDVYNHVKIMSNTPDFTPFFADDVDWSSINNPDTEGFIGYIKSVYQKDGSFGSLEAARNIINFYKAMRRPPLVINFESYGLPVRALDIIIFDKELARIMKVDCTISPKENKWWNSLECEWLYPSTNLEAASCQNAKPLPNSANAGDAGNSTGLPGGDPGIA